MRAILAGTLVAAAAATVATLGSLAPTQPLALQGGDDYQEECNVEGCSDEEVEELYESYAEECLNEGCSPEEVFELGGSTQGVRDMRAHFERQKRRIDPSDFQGVDPNCLGTTTSCAAFLLLCNDHCIYPDGSSSSTYVCGGCIGLWW